ELDSLMRQVVEDVTCVPAHWILEITNTLVISERRGKLQPRQRQEILEAIKLLPIKADDETWLRGWDVIPALADRFGLTTYDAAYLELAMRLQAPLATLDQDLVRAARAAKVPLFQ
ncbi:MAG: type II toxin-antitoxin system VapC family toxin, partial [Gammaproteobacteria bacterium]